MVIIGCEQVLRILRDGKPHMNLDIFDMLGGGFALAARVWDLRKPEGKYKLEIESGPPKKFNKIRQHRSEWWYQLMEPEIFKRKVAEPVTKCNALPEKQLTMKFIKSHSGDLDGILA